MSEPAAPPTSNGPIPNQFVLMWPTLQALKDLGGSARISEIVERVIAAEGFSEEQQAVKRRDGDHMSKIEYRLAWARNGLKLIGAIENSSRGVWSLTEKGRSFGSTEELISTVKQWRAEYAKEYNERKRHASPVEGEATDEVGDSTLDVEIEDAVEPPWQDQLLARLGTLSPSAFERLAQRLLREAGFRDVAVVGKSGDGGIDGVGVLRVSLISFPVYFQCKRFKDSVGSGAVRDFRGAMAGRGEKGLLITTGTFTREAHQEASRDGAPPVELISGQDLTELLRQYELGVISTQRVVEDITVKPGFFDQFE
jgi:restriction system protein